MKKKTYLFGLIFLLFFVNSIAQTPYFYYSNGKKQYLELNTNHIFVSVAADKDTANVFVSNNIKQQSLRIDIPEKIQSDTKIRYKRFWAELSLEDNLPDMAYWAKLSEIKNMRKDIIVAPYFKSQYHDKIGLSNFFYVKLKSQEDTILLRQEAEKEQVIIVYQNQFMPLWFVMSITDNSIYNAMELANRFYESGLFQYAEPDLMFEYKTSCANDTCFGNQWGLKNTGQYGGIAGIDIKLCDAWQISTGKNITVAVLDNGIDTTHPDLAANMHPLSYDCESGTMPQRFFIDSNYEHGIQVAGIIGAVRNNTTGIAGVAPDCKLMAVSNTLDVNILSQMTRADGINWAWKHGADVINNSWSISVATDSMVYPLIKEAIDSAVTRGRKGKGCVVVFCSGNYNAPFINYPATLSDVISVGAIIPNGQRKSISTYDGEYWWGSNYGPSLDVVAPGINIHTTRYPYFGEYNSNFNGTSAAAPHVSGIAALILSVDSNLTQQQVRNIIEYTAQKTRPDLYNYQSELDCPNGTWHKEMGYGLIDAYAAVVMAQTCNHTQEIDLMIRDIPDDAGVEPNPINEILWNSPDIWIRNKADNISSHQSFVSNTTNYVYVRIKNIGDQTSLGNEKLNLYWAKEGTSLAWPFYWTGNYLNFGSGPLLTGGLIGTKNLPSIPSNGEYIMSFEWNTPNPVDYEITAFNNFDHFRLLARIEGPCSDNMTFSETRDIDSNVRNNNNIAGRSISYKKGNLMVRDTEDDAGIEPNPSAGAMWNSPDIWIRNRSDANVIHQNPIPNTINYIYVRIKNIGSKSSKGNELLRLYWAQADSLSWPRHWNGSVSLFGNFIDSLFIPLMQPGESLTVAFSWYAPNPTEYVGMTDNPSRFGLLARIEENDPLGYPETEDIESNVRNNNSIAWKSVNLGNEGVDLMVRDTEGDIGKEPNDYGAIMYNSPDIWVRNIDDGGYEHQSPQSNTTNYVYVRVKNIGNETSRGDEQLYLYWAKASASLIWDYYWTGNYFPQGPLIGNYINSLHIPAMPSGGDTIIKFQWDVPNADDYVSFSNIVVTQWHFCLLARIIANNDPMTYSETSDINNNVKYNNNIAQRNVNVVEIKTGNIGGVIAVGNAYNRAHSFCLQFKATDAGSATLVQEAEITAKLDTVLYRAWQRGGATGVNIEDKGGQTILIKGNNASLRNIIFEPKEFGLLDLRFNFLTQEITGQVNYEFHVMQTDHETGDIIGGEAYSIIKSARTPFYADAGEEIYAYPNENIQLSAVPVGEAATYNWYLNDSLVHTGMSFNDSAVIGRKYKLEVIASDDGYKDYAEVEIKEDLSNLIIRDTEDDTGMEPVNGSGMFLLNSPESCLWYSPDIWLRHEPDSIQEHQDPEWNRPCFVYVKIKNIGNTPSRENQQLLLYSGRIVTYLKWLGESLWSQYYESAPMMWNLNSWVPIPAIPAGEEIILEIPLWVSSYSDGDFTNFNPWGKPSSWSYCILARIEGNKPMTFPETDDSLYRNVGYNNKIALKSVSVLEIDEGYSTRTTIAAGQHDYRPSHLVFIPYFGSDYNEVEIKVRLDPVLYDAWTSGGRRGSSINYIGEQTILLDHGNGILENLYLWAHPLPYELGLMDIQFNFLEPPSQASYYLDVIQVDATSNEIIGGTTIHVKNPQGSYSSQTNAVENISINRENTLQLIQDSTEVKVETKPNKIVSISPNPTTNEITVAYELNEVENASIYISNYYFTGLSDNYILDIHSQSRTFNVWNYTTGFYIVTLVCDGKVADSKTFVKH